MVTYKIKFVDDEGNIDECYKSAENLFNIVSYLSAFNDHYVDIIRMEKVNDEDAKKLVSIPTI